MIRLDDLAGQMGVDVQSLLKVCLEKEVDVLTKAQFFSAEDAYEENLDLGSKDENEIADASRYLSSERRKYNEAVSDYSTIEVGIDNDRKKVYCVIRYDKIPARSTSKVFVNRHLLQKFVENVKTVIFPGDDVLEELFYVRCEDDNEVPCVVRFFPDEDRRRRADDSHLYEFSIRDLYVDQLNISIFEKVLKLKSPIIFETLTIQPLETVIAYSRDCRIIRCGGSEAYLTNDVAHDFARALLNLFKVAPNSDGFNLDVLAPKLEIEFRGGIKHRIRRGETRKQLLGIICFFDECGKTYVTFKSPKIENSKRCYYPAENQNRNKKR